MSIEVRIPALPESVTDATIAAWHKQPGEPVQAEENLLDLETDKVVLDVPAPASGVLREILAEAGATVHAGDVVAVIEETASAEQPVEEAPGEKSAPMPAMSPAVRRLVEAEGLDPRQIPATGKHGRLLKEDVERWLQAHSPTVDAAGAQQDDAAPPARADAEASDAHPGARADSLRSPSAPPPSESRREQRVPMTRLRARIAERLVAAQQQTAMLTTFNEVDMSAVSELRARYREQFEQAHGVRLGFMSFFVRAACEALRRWPMVNASIDGHDIVYHGYFDIGIAVSTERGLVVPVLRDADRMSLAEIEQAIRDFATRAREGRLELEELTGGTFSITNGGVFGSLFSTPILNPPQSAILGMHRIQERPVAIEGEVVIRPMMYLALTYDHRLIDGREAVSFLVTIKELIEDPARLLLDL
ncbi:MAG: 2-oxoglutarate dehydrogenase complex dihydrolipoyllysine-residue succinyltransferase [Gammaproteobacteria bacterium]|nr:MAG: 2-oxoglutarate dehydrogenase complex dihydrolipoyllysine-residue succinyltransferase [Gammaproteobacteria bacterium]